MFLDKYTKIKVHTFYNSGQETYLTDKKGAKTHLKIAIFYTV